jgi:hypothetical protein
MATINIDPVVAGAIQAQTALEKIDSLQDKAITLAILGQLQLMNLNMEKNWGELALGIPGSIRNSEANQAAVLATISNSLMDLNDNAIKMTSTISELSSTIKVMNSTMNQMATVQKIAVSDQISANNFQQRETLAALERNEIEPTIAPDFKKVVEQQITNSTLMSASSAFTTAITDFSNSIITGATNYISQTEIVTWGKATIENLLVKLKLTRAANAVANPEEVAIKAAKNTVNTKAGAGLWAPTVIPPDL